MPSFLSLIESISELTEKAKQSMMSSQGVQEYTHDDNMSMPPPGTVELLEFNTNEVGEPVIIHLPVPTNDPNDPLNWPNWRKNLNFFFVFAFSAAVFTT